MHVDLKWEKKYIYIKDDFHQKQVGNESPDVFPLVLGV